MIDKNRLSFLFATYYSLFNIIDVILRRKNQFNILKINIDFANRNKSAVANLKESGKGNISN